MKPTSFYFEMLKLYTKSIYYFWEEFINDIIDLKELNINKKKMIKKKTYKLSNILKIIFFFNEQINKEIVGNKIVEKIFNEKRYSKQQQKMKVLSYGVQIGNSSNEVFNWPNYEQYDELYIKSGQYNYRIVDTI